MLSKTKYSFSWTPKPVDRRSTCAQKGTPTERYRNVMYDKRVIRGSNYGATSIELDFNKASEWRRRNILRKRNMRNVIGTPPPLMGRRHEVIQTDKYLEELLDYPPVRTIDTQTDLFLETPPTPTFIAGKIGVDVGTTIDPGDLSQEETGTTSDEEMSPLIECFIELCISDTAQEMELENGKKDIYRMMDFTEPPLEDEVVDSNEILGDIIEEIIKQRELAIDQIKQPVVTYKECGIDVKTELGIDDDR